MQVHKGSIVEIYTSDSLEKEKKPSRLALVVSDDNDNQLLSTLLVIRLTRTEINKNDLDFFIINRNESENIYKPDYSIATGVTKKRVGNVLALLSEKKLSLILDKLKYFNPKVVKHCSNIMSWNDFCKLMKASPKLPFFVL